MKRHAGDNQQTAVGVEGEKAPVRKGAKVYFSRPVQIGSYFLQYIIEHDTNRQARREPCTHIYAADNPRVPIVTFHCTHLEKPAKPHATLTLAPASGVMGLARLTAFQFAGETAAHGVPAGL